jgi:hypothetical protein
MDRAALAARRVFALQTSLGFFKGDLLGISQVDFRKITCPVIRWLRVHRVARD